MPHPNLISPERLFECCGWYYVILPNHIPLLDICTGVGAGGPMLPLVKDLIAGLSFLHQHDTAHLDLNPGNLICTTENQLKIIDFDLALRAKKGERIFGIRGTEGWMAPEVKKNNGKDGFEPFKVDLYSCGKVLEFMDRASKHSLGKWLSDAAAQLMAPDPETRPSLEMLQWWL
ncbi:kinase-like protein [Gymnopus androsaceus JB14]|uniref:Kinase-like protein n=1 Tax=Gymnopus androsaceus JB14 TaxID=1447944 RepID=A0A6A4H795_9AGAR|nr:kinase-like protein [Gymnopus androsaceus JB14]